MATPNKPKAPAKPFAPAQAVMVSFGRWRVDGRDAKRQHRRFFTGPQAEIAAKKHADELNRAFKAKPAPRAHLPAVAVSVGPGRYRVDGRDAKRMYRRFFTGPNAEKDAKAHAAQLNAAPKPTPGGPAKPGAKLGGVLRGVIDAHAGLEAKKAATAKAKLAAKGAPGQFAALQRETAVKLLNDLTPTSTRHGVVFAIRQAELAGLPQAQVEQILAARGFGASRLGGFVNQLKAETAKA